MELPCLLIETEVKMIAGVSYPGNLVEATGISPDCSTGRIVELEYLGRRRQINYHDVGAVDSLYHETLRFELESTLLNYCTDRSEQSFESAGFDRSVKA